MHSGWFQERDSSNQEDKSDYGYVETDPTGRYGRFEVVLGKGAMKTVYKAFDEVLGLEVAWNRVKLHDLLQTPEDLERLYSEVHLLRTLNHDSIIQFHTSWIDVDRKTFNFITEMLTSGTLREYRKKYKRVHIGAIKNWARQILGALVYLHEHDPPVIHRDLKCDNIFVNGHLGQVKIGDLGLAAILSASQTAHSVIGTPEFMAPELYEENYNELVDIYSFGMCVLEMITSEYPYSECTNPAQIYKKVTSGKLPRAFYKVEDLEAQQFIGKCLEPATKRLSAKELLLDPFFACHDDNLSPGRKIAHQKPLMTADLGISQLQLNKNPPRTEMTITGKLNPEDDTIFLKVQIADEGSVRNIYFPFDISSDTSFDVANEMVKELEITDWEPIEIAHMIEEEISAIVPHWKKQDQLQSDEFQVLNCEEHDENQRLSYSSCSSSQVSFSRLLHSQPMSDNSDVCDWVKDEYLFDDSSSQSSLNSEKYSNFNYYSDTDNSRRDHQYQFATMHSATRFCPSESASSSRGRYCQKECRVMPPSNKDCSSKGNWPMNSPCLTKNRSLVDMRSQLLHKSLVEEVRKRRLFNTVGAVENVGFQSPYEVSAKQTRPSRTGSSKRVSK